MSTTTATAPSAKLENYAPVPTYWQLMVSQMLDKGAPKSYSTTDSTDAGKSTIRTDILHSAEGDDIRQTDTFTPINGSPTDRLTCTIRFKLDECNGFRTFKIWSGDQEIKNPLEANKEFNRIMSIVKRSPPAEA